MNWIVYVVYMNAVIYLESRLTCILMKPGVNFMLFLSN